MSHACVHKQKFKSEQPLQETPNLILTLQSLSYSHKIPPYLYTSPFTSHPLIQGDIEEQRASFQSSGNVEFKCFQCTHKTTGSITLLTSLTLPEEDTYSSTQSQFNLSAVDKKSSWCRSGALITAVQIIFHTNSCCLCVIIFL